MFPQSHDFSHRFNPRTNAEWLLPNSEAFLIPILEAIPDPLFVKDQQHCWIIVNDAFCELVGQPREALLGKTDYDFFPKLQADRLWQQDEIAFQQGKTEQEETLTNTRGQTHILSTKKTVFTQPDGSQILVGIIRDITTLKQQQIALQESQARFERLTSNLPGMIYQFHRAMDDSVSFPYVSNGCRELFELEPGDIYQNCYLVFDQVHPDDLPGVLESTAISANTLTQWEYEWRNRTPSGQMKWLKGKARPEQQIDGSILWDGVIMDITELKENQNFIHKLANAIPLVIYLFDLIEQRNIYANQEITGSLGYTTEDIQRMGSGVLPMLMHPDDLAQYPHHLKRLQQAQDGELIEWEYRMRSQTGEWRTFWSREVLFSRTVEGQPWRILGIATDITERQRDQAALRISEERLHLALNATQDGIWDWNVATGETYFSPAFKAMLGYIGDEMAPQINSWEKLIHPDDKPRVVALLTEHFHRKSEYYEAEFRMRTKSWDWKWILAQGQVAEWDKLGHPLRMVGTHKDIHDRKRAEVALKQSAEYRELAEREARKSQELAEILQQLQQTQINLIQAEKMSSLGQMVAGVAHEINNPVSFIFGNVDYCRDYVADLLTIIKLYQQHYPTPHPEIEAKIEEIDLDFMIRDLPKLLNSMQVGAERIRDIVKSLRTFSRLDEAEMKAVNLHENIDSTIRILEHRLKPQPNHPPIEIIREYGNLPLVECYAGQLNQVFMNLLVNAIDAIEEKHNSLALDQKQKSRDKIHVQTFIEQDQVKIIIADTGLGIKETVLPRIFDPFYTTKPIGAGTGMGLAISYQIVVEKHSGQLSCDSNWGSGTQFMIQIPISQV